MAAQIYALQLRRARAVSLLELAHRQGWRDYPQARTDPALSTLRDHPGFQALLERMEVGAAETLRELRQSNPSGSRGG